MKQLLFFIFMLGITTTGYSQFELGKTFKVIPPKPIPPKAKAKEAPKKQDNKDLFAVIPKIDPKDAKPITEDPTYSNGIEPEPFSMIIKKPDFDDPNDALRDKLVNSLEQSLVNRGMKVDPRSLVRIDVNFGDIRTKSKYFDIRCRDFGEIDGDLIKATLNNRDVESRLLLQNQYKTFRITFKEGINTFELEALNRGTLGGNTAEFQIYDDAGKLVRSDYWENWDTGVKGKFIIVKE
ncbi:hypothetical protein [Flavobacterium sp. 7A]|uniref:hypothetical protein n=1 Tax=Flavobacterium sp. 7A TaxID=2940571 RepID=UPI0022262FEE|nr:hypothetical protein [Flavobacterium sp. 7A]MCW2121151.1 hypothetical protein [Flavobacterium sp. 7A]